MVPIPLKTVRPFIFEEIILSEDEEDKKLKLDDKPKIVRYLKSLVEALIEQAKNEWDDQHQDDPEAPPMMLPLIRLRVEYTRPDGQSIYDVGNPQRFGQDFLGKVANPKDLVQFYRRRKIGIRKPKNDIDLPEEETIQDSEGRSSEKVQVATLVHQYLEAQSLGVLAENGMQRAVTLFVEKDDKDAIKEFYHNALKATQAHVKGSEADVEGSSRQDRNPESEEEELLQEFTKAKESYADEWEKNQNNEHAAQKNKGKAARKTRRNDDDSDESDFGKMSDVQYVGGSDDDNSRNQSDSDGSIQASVAPRKRAPAKAAPAKKAPAKKAAPATKAPAKRAAATTKTPATSSRSRAGGSQTTLNFSQQPPPRGASKRHTQTVPDDSDDSIEVSTQRKAAASRSRR